MNSITGLDKSVTQRILYQQQQMTAIRFWLVIVFR
jgi:hypothetical protein